MSYVANNLMTDEAIEYTAKISWLIYIPSLFSMVIGTLIFAVSLRIRADGVLFMGVGGLVVMMGFVQFLKAFLMRWTTELAVTSKRVIFKTGFIRRYTSELNHVKIESFHVDQSILGRIFDFGTIVIVGTGGGRTPIPNVDAPLEFRKQAMQAMDANLAR